MATGDVVTSAQAEQWGRERVELIKRTICPKGIGDDAFALFIEQCKRSGLDPLLKEAFCVERRQNIGTKERPNWINKHEFQASEGGFLVRANRFPDFMGVQAQAVYSGDECELDVAAGEVAHKFRPGKRQGSLVGAWARVLRRDKLPILVWLDLSGYSQGNAMWSSKGPTMIEKCARVAALRKAYPEAFTAAYIPEEEGEDQAEAREAAAEHQVAVAQVAAAQPPPPAPKAPELPAATSVAQLPKPAPEKAAVPAAARAPEDAQVEPPAAKPTPEQKPAKVTDFPKPPPAAAPSNGAPLLHEVLLAELEALDPRDRGAPAALKSIRERAYTLPKGLERNAVGTAINTMDGRIKGSR